MSVVVIIKFLYLCELLDFKVRRIIEVLFFMFEGYNCVKSILIEKYGKELEIVKVYIKEILEFFFILNYN